MHLLRRDEVGLRCVPVGNRAYGRLETGDFEQHNTANYESTRVLVGTLAQFMFIDPVHFSPNLTQSRRWPCPPRAAVLWLGGCGIIKKGIQFWMPSMVCCASAWRPLSVGAGDVTEPWRSACSWRSPRRRTQALTKDSSKDSLGASTASAASAASVIVRWRGFHRDARDGASISTR